MFHALAPAGATRTCSVLHAQADADSSDATDSKYNHGLAAVVGRAQR
jgi:hypothetical protein